jgi:hypothetical protein
MPLDPVLCLPRVLGAFAVKCFALASLIHLASYILHIYPILFNSKLSTHNSKLF